MAAPTLARNPPLATTPLDAWHAGHGGRLVDFAGWSMPVQYGSIVEEHVATRTGVGLFDVSHMGRLSVYGPDAPRFLDRVVTRRVADLKPGKIRYALVCNEQGGTLDDVLVGRGDRDTHGVDYGMVVNASNREKLLAWFAPLTAGLDLKLTDHTTQTAMIAVQGPAAVAMVQGMTSAPVEKLRYYASCTAITIAGVNCSASRTGYTGEDGLELICDAGDALTLWEALVAAGGKPCGLGARDTLRMEAGMPLYGHELLESITPLEADLGFAVDLEGREFVGHAALQAASRQQLSRVRVGLKMEGKRSPREGAAVLSRGEAVGSVTSGGFSPTFARPIAMALVAPKFAALGTFLQVDLRGQPLEAEVIALPFYKRSR